MGALRGESCDRLQAPGHPDIEEISSGVLPDQVVGEFLLELNQ